MNSCDVTGCYKQYIKRCIKVYKQYIKVYIYITAMSVDLCMHELCVCLGGLSKASRSKVSSLLLIT